MTKQYKDLCEILSDKNMWHRSLKSTGISWMRQASLVLVMKFLVGASGWGLVARRTSHVIRQPERPALIPPAPVIPLERRHWRLNQSLVAKDLIMFLYEAPLDTTSTPSNKLSLESFQTAEHRFPGGRTTQKGHGNSHSSRIYFSP